MFDKTMYDKILAKAAGYYLQTKTEKHPLMPTGYYKAEIVSDQVKSVLRALLEEMDLAQ